MRCLDERTFLQKGAGREEPPGRRVSIVCRLLVPGEEHHAPPQRHLRCGSEIKNKFERIL